MRLVHAWAGAAVALVLITTGGTGVILVFIADILALETGALSPPAASPPDQSAPVGRIIEAAQADAGERFQPLGLLAPYSRLQVAAAMVYGWDDPLATEREILIVGVDPSNGRTLGTFHLERTVGHTLLHIHYDLLAGEVGGIFVAAAAFMLLGLALSGLATWWPPRGRFLTMLGRQTRNAVRRPSHFSLHSVLGVWLAVLVSLWLLSGAFWSRPDWFTPVLSTTWQELPAHIAREFDAATCQGAVTPDEAARIASDAVSDRTIAAMSLPTEGDYFQVRMKGEGDLDDYYGDVIVWIDGTCPHVTYLAHHSQAGVVASFSHTLHSLHSGRLFGAIGIPITLAVGAASTAIGVTGLVLWYRRYVRPLRKGRFARTEA